MAITSAVQAATGDGNTIYTVSGFSGGPQNVSKSNLQQDLINLIITIINGGGGGGPPTGPAGGDLAGTYPNPTAAKSTAGALTFSTFTGAVSTAIYCGYIHSGAADAFYAVDGAAASGDTLPGGLTHATAISMTTGVVYNTANSGTTWTATSGAHSAVQRFIPTDGGTTTIVANAGNDITAFLRAATTISTQTINLPTGGFDGQKLAISWQNSMGTLTYTGATASGAIITTAATQQGEILCWDAVATIWQVIGVNSI